MQSIRILLLAAVAALSAQVRAQQVTGSVVEKESGEAAVAATVKLLKSDSTLAAGATTSTNGSFSVKAPKNGKYILQVSYLGFKTATQNVSVAGKDVNVGRIALSPNSIMLKEATVRGVQAKVYAKDDTLIYNSSAYTVPEGSVLEELVKKLPGAQVDDEGKITINGKEVKKIKMDGKEFMTGDTKTAMKNLPTSMIEKIKAYDEKSDLARISGIDDGNEQTVLDLSVKKGMNRGTFGNVDLGYGTKNRYALRGMGAQFSDKLRVMLMGNANNTNDMGFPGGGGWGRFGNRQGLNSAKMAGVNINYDDGDKLKIDGSLRWNHSDGDSRTNRSSENFVSTTGAFSNSSSVNFSRGNSWNGQMRVEWKPDTMTNIMFRPEISFSTSDNTSESSSAAFSSDPYRFVDNPLRQLDQLADSMKVNSNVNSSLSYSENKRFGGTLQYNRKLNSSGRNLTLRAGANYNESKSNSLSLQNVHLFRLQNQAGTDSTYQRNRFNQTPTKSYNYSAQATYSEPIAKATYLQFSYQFQLKYNRSERSTYDFSNLGEQFFDGINLGYRQWDSYLNILPQQPYTTYLDSRLSRYSEYTNYIHEFQIMLRVIREKYNFHVGVQFIPQSSKFKQEYLGVSTDTTRSVFNWSPTANFRYKFSKQSQLRINYRGSSSQPSISQLLDITDDSDPLNISKGNPGLKPSFTQSMRVFYNNYIENHKQGIMANLDFSTTSNSISNMVTYNETTGGRTSRPENINGNWNVRGAFMYNCSLDTASYFNVNTFTNASYNHYVGYVTLDQKSSSQRNVTRSTSISERLSASYRNDWIEIEPNGSFTFTHSRNMLQTSSNLDTWRFSYGMNVNVTAPWGMRLATDLSMNSRRGYSDKSMNTNELIWNAQVSQSFLKGNALTVSLQFYDILQRQSNFSRTINAMARTDTEFNSINSYAMLHVIYRFNAFGGKEARQGGPGGPPDRGPGGDGRRRGNGGPPPGGGGFGGPR